MNFIKASEREKNYLTLLIQSLYTWAAHHTSHVALE